MKKSKKLIPLTKIQKQFFLDNMYLIIVECKLRLKSKQHGLLSYRELFSAGSLGLIGAIQRYIENLSIDPTNKRWKPYAKKCIKGSIVTEFQNNKLIIIPKYHYLKKHKKILEQRRKDYQEGKASIKGKIGAPCDNLLWQDVERANSKPKPYPFDL